MARVPRGREPSGTAAGCSPWGGTPNWTPPCTGAAPNSPSPPRRTGGRTNSPAGTGPSAGLTPVSGWLPAAPGEVPDPQRLAALAAGLPPGSAVVKDYVKSRKHEWAEACYVPDLADPAALHRVAARFVELQDEFLAGGVVLRAFETFVAPQGAAAEVRVWWRDGVPGLVTAHPDSAVAEVPEPVRAAVEALGCPFVTTDLALRADGVWRVVEVGDGQVSDLHREVDLTAFVQLLTTDQALLCTPSASGTTPA